MRNATWTRRAALAAGGVVVASAAAAPAFAAEYPPNVDPTQAPGTASSPTGQTSGTTTASSGDVAYTGSNATVFGLVAGLAAVGIGGGLVVASRRKKA